MKYIPLLFAAASVLSSCKKAELDKPLSIKDKETYTPAGYNPELKYNKTVVLTSYGTIRDLIFNQNDPDVVTILGNFNGISLSGGGSITSPRIAKYKLSNNTVFNYYTTLDYNLSQINTIVHAGNGLDVLGGQLRETNSTLRYLGIKSPTAMSFLGTTFTLNGQINGMKEVSGKIYFTGAFTQLNGNSSGCSPVLVYDMLNSSVTEYGIPYTFPLYNNFAVEFYNNKIFLLGNMSGYVLSSGGGAWSIAGGGFDYPAYDIAVFDGKLYAAGNMNGYMTLPGTLNYVNVFNDNTQQWEKVGANNLPGTCSDIEYYNGDLYACGYSYICKLDKTTNTWKSILSSQFAVNDVQKIKFFNGKLFILEASGWNYFVSRLD